METEDAPKLEIPNKLYFRIGEVSKLLGVEPYVLRFWETEFPGLSPKKSDTGQRLFRRKDVELLLHIKHLLREKRYTIEGARQSLTERKMLRTELAETQVAATQQALFGPDPLPHIKEELRSLLDLLK
jgi:DNA-binding transcriptional MerR regulator